MEVHAINTLSGREEPLEIDPDATVSEMMRRCGEAFGFGEDVELSVGGQRVACDGVERISNVAAFSGGCRVEVVRGVARFLAKLRSGALTMDSIPVWARERRECVLAVLAFALEREECLDEEYFYDDDEWDVPEEHIPFQPHWVDPSLHGDKEVMLQYVRYDSKAFVRASAAVRSDADVVIAALEQDSSMWRHVENKGLQDQRSVALLAVPHCANSDTWLSDKTFVLEALEKGAAWRDVSKALQEDKEVVMKALDCKKLKNFHQLSATLQEDKYVAMKALDYRALDDFHQLSATLQEDKDVVMKALDCRALHNFHLLSATLQEDKEVATKENARLKYQLIAKEDELNRRKRFQKRRANDELSEALRGDKEAVMTALDCHKLNFHQLSATLQEDKDVVMKALEKKNVKFSDLGEALRGDKELVLKTLDCRALDDFDQLSATLQEDKEVVMKALEKEKVKFGDLSEALRGDKEVVMQALDFRRLRGFYQLGTALQDREVVMMALSRQKLHSFHQLNATLQEDKEVVMMALDCRALEDFHQLSAMLQEDKEVVLKAFRKKKVKFTDLSEALQVDKPFVMQAIAATPETYLSLTGALCQDKDIALAALACSSSLFVRMDSVLRDNLDVALVAIRANEWNFVYAGDSVRADKQAALAAFPQNDSTCFLEDYAYALSEGYLPDDPPVLLPFASAELQADREVVLAAVRVNNKNANYVSPALRDLVSRHYPWFSFVMNQQS